MPVRLTNVLKMENNNLRTFITEDFDWLLTKPKVN
uniref:Uncharacterized protein n=1 Tax=Anguilla anguilla TaxID=7936 RepID=A0A0E9SQY9_ANGAN